MRIISGCCRGRKLAALEGRDIRPTSDRAREAVFNILGPSVKGKRVLDLFAGTGALGLEALSRGASHATFVDRSCDTINQNIDKCRLKENSRIITCDITTPRIASFLKQETFDLVFIDPPYHKKLLDFTLSQTWFIELLTDFSIVIAEHDLKEQIDFLPPVLDIYRQKKYSKTVISFISKLQEGQRTHD